MKKLINSLLLFAVAAIALICAVPDANAQVSGTGNIKTVNTLAQLKLVAPDARNPYCYVFGWTSAGDGGGGMYRWAASSSLTTNYSILASSLNSAGQWIRVVSVASPATQTLAASTAIKAESDVVKVAGTGGATTLTVNPAIAANGLIDGQPLVLIGTSDTDTVVLTDEGGDAGIKLQLGSATRTLGAGDRLILRYNAADTSWYEEGFVNN